MQNKAPQGKTDPIPTPELELERYGVWVKAEPQDVIDEPEIGREALGPTSVDGSDAVLLSEEEEDILDSFDLPEESSEPASAVDSFEEFEELSPLEEQQSSPESPPDDMEIFDFETLEPLGMDSVDTPIESRLDDTVIEDTVIDVPLDELDYEEPAQEAPAADIAAEPARVSDGTYLTTDISIDDFGLSDDDSTGGAPSLESMGSFGDEAPLGDSVAEPADEFESIDIDLQFDDTIPSADNAESVDSFTGDDLLDVSSEFETVDIDSIGLPEEPAKPKGAQPETSAPVPEAAASDYDAISLDSFIDDDTEGSSGIIPDLEIERVSISDESTGFDDIKAVTDDLAAKAPDQSSDLLKQIATELSSIKEELVSLRSQLNGLKAAGATIPEPESDSGIESVDESAPGGFFDDEDDDTIALTGDELDNILNTADFTEEAADDEALESIEAPQLDVPEDIELLPEDGDYASAPEQGIETIDLPIDEPETEEALDLEVQEGVTPLTSLPDDTSFLDETDAEDITELEGMPLDDVPLVEPDPSDLDILVDSAFGNEEEELPIIEAADEEPEPEIVLDIDADDEPVVSTVDSFPEPIEEVEEAFDLEELLEPEDLGGLDLHSEPVDDKLEELDELEETSEEEPAPAAFDSKPVQYHPEDIPTSLDDSLFVEPSPAAEPEPEPVAIAKEPERRPEPQAEAPKAEGPVPDKLKRDVKSVLVYLDQLLASLPEEKIEEFASSEYYDTYKRLFDDLGLL